VLCGCDWREIRWEFRESAASRATVKDGVEKELKLCRAINKSKERTQEEEEEEGKLSVMS
jgi:hypothetical protein